MFRRQQLHYNRGTMFSTRSVLRSYKKDNLEVAVSGVSELVGELVR
jgi:hypothetical protein